MELNAAQQSAVSYLSGPLLVLAGPGTGKTQLLSAKVAHILTHTDTNPENILCITFTDNGAINMRNRLNSLVGPTAHQVNISTYHALGLNVLYRYQHYSPHFQRQLDRVTSDVMGFNIIQELLSQLPANDILRGDNVKDVLATITDAKAARLSAADLTQISQINKEQSAQINAALAPVLALTKGRQLKFSAALETVYQPALTALTPYLQKTPILGQVESLANHLARKLHTAIESERAKEKPSVSPLTKWRNEHFELDHQGNWRLSNLIANKKLASLGLIMQQYQDYLQAHNLYDFNDMIELAINTLKQDRGFRLSLNEQYQHILLDEFQDTNPAQFELIRLLTDYEQPNIMAVGDDDQAIYSFQGAEASNLLDFQAHYQAKVIVLTDNYRSSQAILDLSRHVADQLSSSFAQQHQINKQLTAQVPRATDITRHHFNTAAAEATWLAQQVSNLIKKGCTQSEIAIIAPRHRYLAALLPYLKQHPDINISYEKRDNILTEPAIAQLLKLARFIFDLASEKPAAHHALEILSFPFWQLAPTTAITLAYTAKQQKQSFLKTIAQSNDPKLQNLTQFISTLVQVSYDAPLELFLDYLIGSATPPNTPNSPFLAYYQTQSDEVELYQLYDHLHVIRSAILENSPNPNPKLIDLVHFVDDYTAANLPLTSHSPYQNTANSVQLLSAHKAKGLEFEHVFLFSVDDLAWGNSKGNNNMLSLPKNLLQIRHTGHTDDECIRLFFVALTRAKTHLTLTSATTNFFDQKTSALQYLSESDRAGQLTSPFLPSTNQVVQIHQDPITADQIWQDRQLSWLSAYQKLDLKLQDFLLKRLEHYRLSATDLTHFIDLKYAGPQSFYQSRILAAPPEPASQQILLGNLIHACFEQVTKAKLDDASALAYFDERLAQLSLLPKDRQDLLVNGHQALTTSLQQFGKLLRAPTALAEVDFRQHHLQIGQLAITGKVDHIQIDPDTKNLTIYDFKTGAHHRPGKQVGWAGQLALFKYSLQLEFYKLLLKTSHEYRNYQINTGHILFVKPDHEDQVYDETYHFSDQSAQDFLALAQAVYYQITSLAFLQQPALNLATDPNCSIKDIKAFLAQLIKSTPPQSQQ